MDNMNENYNNEMTNTDNTEEATQQSGPSKLVIGGIFAAGAAAGAVTTKLVIPGCKKLGRKLAKAFKDDEEDEKEKKTSDEDETEEEESEDQESNKDSKKKSKKKKK